MIAVIADDITGAAEIAGIGLRFGMRVKLVINLRGNLPEVDLLVYATNTRSMPWTDAVEETSRVIRQLKKTGYREIFKKTDSALRGHVVPELNVFLKETGCPGVLYLPQNPSKGRVICAGVYYIDGQPLHETLFAKDPEFPATTSRINQIFPEIGTLLSPGEAPDQTGIMAANAERDEDIEGFIRKKNSRTLLAGGADLFAVWLRVLGWKEQELPEFAGLGTRDSIIVCGSTARHLLTELDYFKRKKIPLETMPKEVFELHHDPRSWFTALEEVYELHHSIAIAIGHSARKGVKYAIRLRNIMAMATSALIDVRLPHELIIEGGATAFAILQLLGWDSFRVTEELSPGVVRMKPESDPADYNIGEDRDLHITLKPGSYPWGDRIFRI